MGCLLLKKEVLMKFVLQYALRCTLHSRVPLSWEEPMRCIPHSLMTLKKSTRFRVSYRLKNYKTLDYALIRVSAQ